ncbi:hypothetical protein O6H91_02G124000 [Diphasiastrum complanatum]|uniref:Uncharacterized protein n=2 Tax=Diphasiastrum complanatum TaxID=34168 RepID=A0ACC2EKK0_DIPCM|nr:hypothetical protein O6H91_02G124000 [Diphasiastrum complanatum]
MKQQQKGSRGGGTALAAAAAAGSPLRPPGQGSVGDDDPDEDGGRKLPSSSSSSSFASPSSSSSSVAAAAAVATATVSVMPSPAGGSLHCSSPSPSFSSSSGSSSKWIPCQGMFKDYALAQQHRRQQQQHSLVVGGSGSMRRAGNLRLVVTQPLVARLTRHIVETFQLCNPSFTYSETFNPKRVLTHPSVGVSNNGLDNSNSDLILSVNGVLVHPDSNQRYIVKDLLGQGTFGQVAKCWAHEAASFVAIKVIKNQPAYYHQALVEISILNMLNKKFDPGDKHHIVRIADHFFFQGHLCIVFELLSVNLFELLKVNHYRGISLHLLRLFTKQILDALAILRDASVIHCDLKPENILLTSLQSGEIKLIDFGSACMENRPVYSYIQSRFYRSPEVVLGHPYTTAIDMWSLGCIVAELFLGVPLFPGESEYDLLKRMLETLGAHPPDHLLRTAKNTAKYFRHTSAAPPSDNYQHPQQTIYQFITEEEYELREKKRPIIGKHHHRFTRLEDIIMNYPFRSKLVKEDIEKEHQSRVCFVDFIRGLVQFDPVKRWTPNQAASHPFVTEQPFSEPYKPLPETARTPVCQAMAVKHNPGSGHWFGAGLSPRVNSNRGFQYNPPVQAHRLSYASSHGSYGSVGSYGDGIGPGSSYGSYSDLSNMYLSYPTPPAVGMSGQMQGGPPLVLSPDTWWRVAPMPPNAPPGYGSLGMSPSSSGFKPMSLGGSPSQFTPPGAPFLSPGSPAQSSPSRYGPASPARGAGISTLGKAAAVGHYNKSRGWGSPLSGSPHEGVMPHQQHPQNASAGLDAPFSYLEGPSRANHLGSPRSVVMQGQPHIQPWRHRIVGNSAGSPGSFYRPKTHIVYEPGSLGALLSSAEVAVDGGDDMPPPPDPGDWDPYYSGNDLLEDETNDIGGQGLYPVGAMGSGAARLGAGPGSVIFSGQGPGVGSDIMQIHNNQYVRGESSNSPTLPRSIGQVRGHMNSFRSLEGSPSSSHGYVYGQQLGHVRSKSKSMHHGPFSPQQTSPSRLGQQASHFQQQRKQQWQYRHHFNSQLQNPLEVSTNAMGHRRSASDTGGFPLPSSLFSSPRRDASLVYSSGPLEVGDGSSSNVNNPVTSRTFSLASEVSQMPHLIRREDSQTQILEHPTSWLALSSLQSHGHFSNNYASDQRSELQVRSLAPAASGRNEYKRGM